MGTPWLITSSARVHYMHTECLHLPRNRQLETLHEWRSSNKTFHQIGQNTPGYDTKITVKDWLTPARYQQINGLRGLHIISQLLNENVFDPQTERKGTTNKWTNMFLFHVFCCGKCAVWICSVHLIYFQKHICVSIARMLPFLVVVEHGWEL